MALLPRAAQPPSLGGSRASMPGWRRGAFPAGSDASAVPAWRECPLTQRLSANVGLQKE